MAGLFALLFTYVSLFSQTPKGFNYQAAARASDQQVLANSALTVHFSILNGSGELVWKEQHEVTTSDLGLFSVVICSDNANRTGGSASSLEEIPWSTEALSLKVEVDDGSGTADMGTQPLMAVPYALFALEAGSGSADADSDPTNEIQDLQLTGDELTITGNPSATPINLASYNESNVGWTREGEHVVYVNGNVGVGTITPEGRLSIQGVDETEQEPLFMVTRKDGYPVFAVYEHGVYAFTDTVDSGKGIKGGFAVGGYRTEYKGIGEEYMRVNADSIRFYVHQDTEGKGLKGGFAVGGYTTHYKGTGDEFLRVTPDSVRVYIDDDPDAKGLKGGFAVGGYTTQYKGGKEYFNISGLTEAEVIPGENRVVWYPQRNAFLTGNVLVESADSVGENSMASGFQVKAVGDFSEAFGYKSIARGDYSTAIGKNAVANAENSISFGNQSYSGKTSSFAFGTGAEALGENSYAIGSAGVDSAGIPTGNTIAYGEQSFSIGQGSESTGFGAFSIGTDNLSSGKFSNAYGYKNKATGSNSIAFGFQNQSLNSNAVSMGYYSSASGQTCLAIGMFNLSDGNFSSSVGYTNTSMGEMSFSAGSYCQSWGKGATSLGYGNQSYGDYSMAMGMNSYAGGTGSTAFGPINVNGNYSFGISLNNMAPQTINNANTMAIIGGKVGIGTTSPTSVLEVVGNIELQDDNWIGVAGPSERIVFDANGNDIELMGANVGIGDTDPSEALEVAGDGRFNGGDIEAWYGTRAISIRQDNSNSYISNIINFASNGSSSNNGQLIINGQEGISFRYGSASSAGTESMKLHTNGCVSIGTNSIPGSKLLIQGTGTGGYGLSVNTGLEQEYVDIGSRGNSIKVRNLGTGISYRSGIWTEAGTNDGNTAYGIVSKVWRNHSSGSYYSGYFEDINNSGTYHGLYADYREGDAIDIAEYIYDTEGTTQPGDVLVADRSHTESVLTCSVPFQTSVLGIVSTQPHLTMGTDLVTDSITGEPIPGVQATRLALNGRVPCKVTDENGSIEPGDLLTTSSTPGHAMKWTLLDVNEAGDFAELKAMIAENDRRRNAIIGKAVESHTTGTGKIMVLVALQ